jgi:hypothetical protein
VVEESVCVETREQIDAAAWRHVDRACYILPRRKGERVGHGSPVLRTSHPER